jgi:hypothetical protein
LSAAAWDKTRTLAPNLDRYDIVSRMRFHAVAYHKSVRN